MSFAAEVRNELARVIPEKKCCCQAEMHGLFITNGQELPMPNEECLLLMTAENAATARKIYQLLKQTYEVNSTVKTDNRKRFKKSRSYQVQTVITTEQRESVKALDVNRGKSAIYWPWLVKSCCKRSFLRGIFLSRGFISKPESHYHLEIVLNDSKLALDIQKVLHKVNIPAGLIQRKQQLVLYVKESEKIVDFLRLVGASKGLLYFENVRILKSMRNNVNRQVNCETANLAKTIEASLRQIELVEQLVQTGYISRLTPPLAELAQLRLLYTDATLKELGEMLIPPLSKSGTAYHMRKLEKMAIKIQSQD